MPEKTATAKPADTDTAADTAAEEAPAARPGDLVELHDGAYALVASVDPVHVVRLGVPERHELPLTPVS